jgi:dihydrofolate reductase
MGSTTLESIGRLLPNRTNIILSKKPQEYFDIYGECSVFDNFDTAVNFAKTLTKDVYICGGANVYKQALEKDYIHEMIVSVIKKNCCGDVYFPEFHSLGWMVKEIIYETESFITKRYVR